MINFGTKSEYVLGISASSRRVEAVLLHNASTGPIVVRTFSRKRNGANPHGPSETPEIVEIGSDISFETGTPSDMDTMFLASEFGGAEPSKKEPASLEIVGSNVFAQPCDLEIQDIIAECADAGYENISVVFALSTENLGTAQIQASGKTDAKGEEKGKKGSKGNKGETLLQQLKSSNTAKITNHKTTFVPLAETASSVASHMAVFALPTEPITISLQSIRDRKRPFPNVALMDTEPTLMLGLVRAALLSRPAEESKDGVGLTSAETTVLVRVGTEDTLVLFLSGDQLVHFESLRSVTAFDPAETICSRILLMHDEFGLGDADNMFLFSDAGELGMYQNLSQFFPQTRIKLLRDYLPHFSEERVNPLEKEGLLATAVTLRLVRDELYQAVFPEVDFMDPKLKGRRFQLPFSWPVAAMILLLFGSTLFFVHRYFDQSHVLEMTRFELKNIPVNMISEDADVLQTRIDSLRMRSEDFVDALDLLDSLLIGSDKWSRALERTSVNTENITGLWIERWEESSSNLMSMTGTATNRSQIVTFATKSGANIESLEFSSIRDVPVYMFKMTMPLKNGLPEAAIYLREHASDLPNSFSEALQTIESASSDSTVSTRSM
ncbi:hypothetical protein HQ496_14370 [bacterium]|nr:hypothetical protein [bacterium]